MGRRPHPELRSREAAWPCYARGALRWTGSAVTSGKTLGAIRRSVEVDARVLVRDNNKVPKQNDGREQPKNTKDRDQHGRKK